MILIMRHIDQRKARTANKGFAIAGVQCFADTFVDNQTLVLRINIYAEKPTHRKPANRYRQALHTRYR